MIILWNIDFLIRYNYYFTNWNVLQSWRTTKRLTERGRSCRSCCSCTPGGRTLLAPIGWEGEFAGTMRYSLRDGKTIKEFSTHSRANIKCLHLHGDIHSANGVLLGDNGATGTARSVTLTGRIGAYWTRTVYVRILDEDCHLALEEQRWFVSIWKFWNLDGSSIGNEHLNTWTSLTAIRSVGYSTLPSTYLSLAQPLLSRRSSRFSPAGSTT